jgi:hypothetical protein
VCPHFKAKGKATASTNLTRFLSHTTALLQHDLAQVA